MNNQAMNIRPADENDIDVLESLNREVQAIHIRNYPHIFKETSSEEVKHWIRGQLKSDNVFIFVACNEKYTVGYLGLRLLTWPENPFMYSRKFTYIDQICVTQSQRGHGIGRELIEHAIAYATSLGFDQVELDVWHANTNARIAFEKIGFKTFNEKRVLYRDV